MGSKWSTPNNQKRVVWGWAMEKNLASVLSAVMLVVSLACSQKSARDIRADDNGVRIGVFLSLTGETASFGISSLNAIKLATEEMNTAGGISGRRIELLVEDDHSRTQEVAALVNKLISQDKVHALLAESVSTRALVAAPIAQANKIVMISPAAVKPEVTMQGDYVFRSCFISPAEGAAIARFAVNKLKAKRAAIILDEKNDYAMVLANFFRDQFNKLGGEVVDQQNYQASDLDLSKQMKAIEALKPEVIFAPGFYTTAVMVARAVKQQQIKAPLIGSDGWDSPNLLESGGEALHGVYYANHFWVNGDDPLVRKFVGDYKTKYGVPPDALAATAYDGARMLFDAIRRAESTQSGAIRYALAQTKDFRGVTGVITLNPERNATAPVYILRVEKDGSLSLQESVK
jgi:branched-chain amino acid transport system substrate-binding protein